MTVLARFLQTSDWQLGMKALQAGPVAGRVREARFACVLHIGRIAKEQGVDFVVIAGDTFEDHNVDDLVVKKAVDALNQFAPLPVYVITGNHDPAVRGGVWDRASWKRVGRHVHLITDPTEVDVATGVTLYACPLKQKASAADPTAWIPDRAPGDSGIRIGLAHGSLDLLPDGASNFPIASSRAEKSGLDFLALGDWHGLLIKGETAYSGTPEPTKFGESDPGNVLVVEVSNAGDQPRITPIRAAGLSWTMHEREIVDLTDVQSLERDMRESGELQARLLRVRVRLTTDTTPDAAESTNVLRQQVLEEALFCDWPEVEPPLPRDKLALPSGALTEADAILQRVIAHQIPDGIGRALAASPPDVVAEARRLLHRVGRRSA